MQVNVGSHKAHKTPARLPLCATDSEDEGDITVPKIDLTLTTIKSKLPGWLYESWAKLTPTIVEKSWEKTGLLSAWDLDMQIKAVEKFGKGELFALQKQAGDHVEPTIGESLVDEPDGELGDDQMEISDTCPVLARCARRRCNVARSA